MAKRAAESTSIWQTLNLDHERARSPPRRTRSSTTPAPVRLFRRHVATATDSGSQPGGVGVTIAEARREDESGSSLADDLRLADVDTTPVGLDQADSSVSASTYGGSSHSIGDT